MRPILLSILATTILTGCAGGGRRPGDAQLFGPPDERGRAIKVSVLRFDLREDLVTRQRAFTHIYRLMWSDGWTRKRGRLDERLLRVFPNPYRGEGLSDELLAGFVRALFDAGLGELRETPPELINLEALKRIEKTGDRITGARTRIITVETDTFKKTVTYDGNDDSTAAGAGPLLRKFLAVESVVIRFADLYTVLTTRETLEAVPK